MSSNGDFDVPKDLKECTCKFFKTYELPCSYIFFIAVQNNEKVPELAANPCWKIIREEVRQIK